MRCPAALFLVLFYVAIVWQYLKLSCNGLVSRLNLLHVQARLYLFPFGLTLISLSIECKCTIFYPNIDIKSVEIVCTVQRSLLLHAILMGE